MKKRLDILVFEKGLAESREKAKTLIMEGLVYVDNQKSDKPGTSYSEECNIEVRDNRLRYVSRGGLKLEKALESFDINLKDAVCMDVGASTGGFTDCMLKNGAKKVYSVDVGYGQLDWKLRNNPQVVNLERTNIRHIDKSLIKDKIS
ncbi:MAG: TlyA family RNA methyltransferase, partial [Clostridia bacterium]|nr:TlyA family RNA methyltransferase [Clostridia bacterium]